MAKIKEVTILRRTLRWTKEGIEYEADEECRKKLMEEENENKTVGPAI